MIIYLVTQAEGSYDDYSCRNLMGFRAQWRAEEHIKECQAADARYNEQAPKVRAFFREWEQKNKMGADHEKIDWPPPLPKNASKQQQQARGRIVRSYKEIQYANAAKTDKWNDLATEVCRQYMREIGVTDEDAESYSLPMWSASKRDYSYDIEEIVIEDDPNEL